MNSGHGFAVSDFEAFCRRDFGHTHLSMRAIQTTERLIFLAFDSSRYSGVAVSPSRDDGKRARTIRNLESVKRALASLPNGNRLFRKSATSEPPLPQNTNTIGCIE